MSELGPSERRLLSALRAADEPTNQDRERVRNAVLAKVAVGSGLAAAASATTAKAATAGATGAAATKSGSILALVAAHWKAGVAVALLGTAGGVGTWWVVQARTAPHVDGAPAQAPVAPPTLPAHEPRLDAAADPGHTHHAPRTQETRAPTAPARHRAAARAEPSETGRNLDEEVKLLGRAQQAMQQGNAERALQLLDEHAAKHPSGVLSQERAGVRAIALCRTGRLGQGRAAARKFLARSPNSPLVARIRTACFPRDD